MLVPVRNGPFWMDPLKVYFVAGVTAGLVKQEAPERRRARSTMPRMLRWICGFTKSPHDSTDEYATLRGLALAALTHNIKQTDGHLSVSPD